MEVHAHTHTARKKWIHYFWEFLMLFLAVFCGFMAENFREHQIEHQREKKYMITLVEDLKRDTFSFRRLKEDFSFTTARKDSFALYLRPPVRPDKIPQYYREVGVISSMTSFAYSDRTIEQLRQSGNFRLLRKKNITDSLTRYDNRMRITVTKIYDDLWEERKKLHDEAKDILDNASYEFVDGFSGEIQVDSLKQKNLWPLKLVTSDEKLLMRMYNHALLQRAYMLDFLTWIAGMSRSAQNLISLIQKEYHLK